MHAATEAIGMMASLTSFLLWLPQGARVWKHRHDPSQLGGIAMSTQLIALAGNGLWGVYAVLIDSFWLGAPALVNGPIAILTIMVLRRGGTSAAPASGSAARGASVTPAPGTHRPVAESPAAQGPVTPAPATRVPVVDVPVTVAAPRVRDVRELVPA